MPIKSALQLFPHEFEALVKRSSSRNGHQIPLIVRH
jgi:NADH-quinone oxidoreductase subunit F